MPEIEPRMATASSYGDCAPGGQCRTCQRPIRWGTGCIGPEAEVGWRYVVTWAGPSTERGSWRVTRLPRPQGDLYGPSLGEHCPDCGAPLGGFHHYGCDLERGTDGHQLMLVDDDGPAADIDPDQWDEDHQWGRPLLCGDCGRSVDDENFMVQDAVWAAAGVEPEGGQLCVGCIESRLGRRLGPADFTDSPLNWSGEWSQTHRLRSRLHPRRPRRPRPARGIHAR